MRVAKYFGIIILDFVFVLLSNIMVKWNRKCIWVVAIVVVHSIVKVMLSRTILCCEMRWEVLLQISSDHTLTHHRQQSFGEQHEKKWRKKIHQNVTNKYSDSKTNYKLFMLNNVFFGFLKMRQCFNYYYICITPNGKLNGVFW